jgi:hypothetical protein
MDILTIINTAVGLMSLVLGALAIFLSLHLYIKSKDAERQVAVALESIRVQSGSLERLTGRWMDRFTRHATEPRPADEGLLALVSTVAALPQTILAHLKVQTEVPQSNEALLRELVDAYIALYYYAGSNNVVSQALLPSEDDFSKDEETHVAIQGIVDRSASDFAIMENVLTRVDANRLKTSNLRHLLDEAVSRWRPHVRYTSQAFEIRRTTAKQDEPAQSCAYTISQLFPVPV